MLEYPQAIGCPFSFGLKYNLTYLVDCGLLKNIQKRYGCRTLGFFVSDCAHNWNNMLYRMDIYGDDRKEANKEYRKFKCVSKENVLGYDNFYLVKGHGKLATESDEFSASSDDSIAKIRSSFKKFSSSKKNNKTICFTLFN